jgi:hypothetical protein
MSAISYSSFTQRVSFREYAGSFTYLEYQYPGAQKGLLEKRKAVNLTPAERKAWMQDCYLHVKNLLSE